jgi:hypothetical protein
MRGRVANISRKLREKRCDGRVIVAIVNDPSKDDGCDARQKCQMCGTKTNHYCTGCKNYVCFGTAQGMNEKRANAIIVQGDTDEGLIKRNRDWC